MLELANISVMVSDGPDKALREVACVRTIDAARAVARLFNSSCNMYYAIANGTEFYVLNWGTPEKKP